MKALIPEFIIQKYNEEVSDGQIEAFCLFADISGFTRLTSDFATHGKEGSEILTTFMNRLFSPAIEAIESAGGFISSFAGDAMTAIFPAENLPAQSVLDATSKILTIFENQSSQITRFGVYTFLMRIGISSGTVDWHIHDHHLQSQFYFRGKPLEEAVEAQHLAQTGEVLLTQDAALKIGQSTIADYLVPDQPNHYKFLPSLYTPTKQNRQNQPIDFLREQNFCPKSVLQQRYSSEFRDVISCFIAFDDHVDYNSFIDTVIENTDLYGGYLNKIDFGDKGPVILVLFGAPISKEKLFERAADFALFLMTHCNIDIRISMDYDVAFCGMMGSTERHEYTALGLGVNRAARMLSIVPNRKVFISASLFENIRDDYLTTLFPRVGEEESNTPVYELIKKSPQSSQYVFRGKMIGREAELQKLQGFLNNKTDNQHIELCYIDGNAGTGKSRLTYECQQSFTARKGQWIKLHCDDIHAQSRNPLMQFLLYIFQEVVSLDKEQQVAAFKLRIASIAAQLKDHPQQNALLHYQYILAEQLQIPWDESITDEIDSATHSSILLSLYNLLLIALSSANPLVILLEDLHWIDPESKKWLENLQPILLPNPCKMIITTRYQVTGERHRLTLREEEATTIELQPLDENNSLQLIFIRLSNAIHDESLLINMVPKKLYDLVWEKSKGIPFYIEQIVFYLIDQNLLDRDLNFTQEAFTLPASIHSLIMARIDKQPFMLKQVLKLASILGREFSTSLLERFVGQENPEISPQFAQWLQAGEQVLLWVSKQPDVYEFTHVILRDTIHDLLPVSQFQALHEKAANLYLAESNTCGEQFAAEIAYHYEMAGNIAQASYYLNKSVKFDIKNAHTLSAIEKSKKVISLVIGNPDHEAQALLSTVFIELGDLYRGTGNLSEAEHYAMEGLFVAKNLHDLLLTLDAYLCLIMLHQETNNFAKSQEYINHAMIISKILKDDLRTGLVLVAQARLELSQQRASVALPILAEAETLFSQTGDIARIGITKHYSATAYQNIGEFEKSWTLYQEAIDIYTIHSPGSIINVKSDLASNYLICDRFEAAEVIFKEILEDYKKSLSFLNVFRTYINLGVLYLQSNAFDQAEKFLLQYLEERTTFDLRNLDAFAYLNLGQIYYNTNRLEEAKACYIKCTEIAEIIQFSHIKAIAYNGLAGIAEAGNDLHKAKEYYAESIDILRKEDNAFHLTGILINMAALCFELSEYDDTLQYAEEAREAAERSRRLVELKLINLLKARATWRKSNMTDWSQIEYLEDMLLVADALNEEAKIAYELWRMCKDTTDIERIRKYHDMALIKNKQLFDESPDPDIERVVKDLELNM